MTAPLLRSGSSQLQTIARGASANLDGVWQLDCTQGEASFPLVFYGIPNANCNLCLTSTCVGLGLHPCIHPMAVRLVRAHSMAASPLFCSWSHHNTCARRSRLGARQVDRSLCRVITQHVCAKIEVELLSAPADHHKGLPRYSCSLRIVPPSLINRGDVASTSGASPCAMAYVGASLPT